MRPAIPKPGWWKSLLTTSDEHPGQHLVLKVQDDGVGFDPERIDEESGLGLTGMKERAHLVDGELEIESAPGRGTTIIFSAPFTHHTETGHDSGSAG